MTRKKQIRTGEKVGLKLTTAERNLLLEGLTCLPSEYEQAIARTPDTEAVMFTLDDLDDLNGYVAAESNHATDKRLQKKLDTIFQKIQHLLEKNTDEEPPKTFKIKDAKKAKEIADYAVQLAEAAAQVLVTAEQLHIKTKPVEHLSLNDSERAVLTLLPTITTKHKKKLVQQDAQFTVAEVASMTMAVAEAFSDTEPMQLVALMIVAKNLLECLRGYTIEPEEPARTQKASRSNLLFQFKITLLEITPPIWRRVQVPDCTLGGLHEVIHAVMGWENCHLHQFIIGGVRYGVQEPELKLKNEEEVMLSQIVPKSVFGN